MRIAMVSEHANPLAVIGGVDAGGQNVHVAALASALARAGHEITVFTRREARDVPIRMPLAPGVVVEHVPAGPCRPLAKDALLPYMDGFGDYLAARFSADRPDVVHAHFWMSGLAALRAGAACGVPVVQTFHALGSVKRRYQGASDTSPIARIALECEIARDADHIIATASEEVFELRHMGAPGRRITVVPCGVDVDEFRPDGDLAPRTGRARIVALGRLVPRKGLDDLIRVLPHMPDAELVIAGGPDAAELDADPEVQRLRAVATELRVEDRIILLGRQSRAQVPKLLRSADVVACVPWYEPFGIVPLEAMACARPVVAAAVGGLVDSVVDGVTGDLVPPGDLDELATTLRDLLDDGRRRARYGAAGRERVVGRYTWRRVAQATADVYADVTKDSVRTAGALQ